MAQDTDPEIQRRLEAAPDTAAVARILTEECGYNPGQALMAAAIMRGESDGDVPAPPADHEPANS